MLYILYMHMLTHTHTHTHSLTVHCRVKSRWPSARLPLEREVTRRPGTSDASHRPTCLWPPGGHSVVIWSSKSISYIHTETGFHVNAAWRWCALISPVSSGAYDRSFTFFLWVDLCVCGTFLRFIFIHVLLRFKTAVPMRTKNKKQARHTFFAPDSVLNPVLKSLFMQIWSDMNVYGVYRVILWF